VFKIHSHRLGHGFIITPGAEKAFCISFGKIDPVIS